MPFSSSSPVDLRLLFAARMIRLFAYGLLAVVLALYLAELGYSPARIGLLLTATLLGGAGLSVIISTRADRLGRRRMLRLGAALMVAGGTVMGCTEIYWLLIVAAIVGVISPTGGEVGPFLAIEQACLAQVIPDRERTRTFAWSHVTGFTANAAGALVGGRLAVALQDWGWSALDSYRVLIWLYAGSGLALLAIFARLLPAVEPARVEKRSLETWHGLHQSKATVVKLSALFTLDAFGGGFVVQSLVAFWFHQRFGVDAGTIGAVLSAAMLFSGLSALVAVPLARKIGLLNTMVFTHLPSSVMLMLVPFMPTFGWAAGLFLARHLISQMDVPTRQSYVNAIVPPGERSAANGVTTTVRQLGTAFAPLVAGPLMGVPALAGWCFVLGGGLKCIYDLAIWRAFRGIKPPEEQVATAGRPAGAEPPSAQGR